MSDIEHDLAANRELVREYHDRVWAKDDLTALEDCWAADAVLDITGFTGNALDTLRADIARYRAAFVDVRTTIHDLLAQDDRVVLHWETSGRHVGAYGSVPATGKVITMRGIDLFRIAGGRIVECRSMWDGLSVYEQLGVLTVPE